MPLTAFLNCPCDNTNFLFYSALHYHARIRSNTIKKRKKTSFLLILKGRYAYTFNGGSFVAEDRSLVIIPRGATYSYRILSEQAESMQLELDVTRDGAPVCLAPTPFVMVPDNASDIERCFRSIIDLYALRPAGYPFLLKSRLFKLFALFIQNAERHDPAPKSKILPARRHIERNFRERLRAGDLAKLCVISESQLRRSFHAELGMSPLEYKRRLQIQYACTLLENESYQITQVAEMAGFDTVYAFSSCFKKLMGLSPRGYRGSLDIFS